MRAVRVPRITELDLPPDVFAVVMATGIVAVAAQDHAYSLIADALGVLAGAAFVVLLAGLAIRVLARPSSAFGQVRDPDVALRLFTFVAACAVLGVRLTSHPAVLWVLGAAAAAAWLILVPLSVRDIRSRPPAELRDHAHGAWLLVSVATAGLATTAADLAIASGWSGLVVVSVVAWVLAIVTYIAVTGLIGWRALTAPFVPDRVTPDSWILMGAVAIMTLAGDHLLAAARALGSWAWLADVTSPVTVAMWVLASLWIPVLLYAEVWRVDRRTGSLHFAGVWWSAVFPLGMYATATQGLGQQHDLPSLATVSLVFFWNALTVWLLVAVGGLASLGKRLRSAGPA